MEINRIKLKNQAIRRSTNDLDNVEGSPEQIDKKPKGLPHYDKPWRDAMKKRQLTLD